MDYTKVIILILWWRTFQLEYWRTFQLVSTVPELTTLQDSRVYKLRERLNNGDKLNREEKNWITRNVRESIYFRRGIALCGYHFDFSDILKRYFVKQHGQICEYYAIDKTALRSVLYGRIEVIVEVSN